MWIRHIGRMQMDKKKIENIERKLNSKTNGFILFKEGFNTSVPIPGMTYGNAGLEAETNIRPPKENEFQEDLNLQKKKHFKFGDKVTINGIPENNKINVFNGLKGTVVTIAYNGKNEVTFDGETTYSIPTEFLQFVSLNEPNIEDNQNFLSTPPITNISLEELKDLK